MRRLAPWILVGVLGIGVVAGAALGESQRPGAGPGFTSLAGRAAASWVAGVLSTTATAGSARFTFVSDTVSPDPSARTSDFGSGAVDFTSGDLRVEQTNRGVAVESSPGQPPHRVADTWVEETVEIGKTVYQNLAAPASDWADYSGQRDPHRGLGLDQASGAEDAVAGLAGIVPVTEVRDLGPATVHGVHATRYRVTNETLTYCGPDRRPIPVTLVAPTAVWVDGQGRIVQVAVSQHSLGASFARLFSRSGLSTPPRLPPSTTTTVLRFSDFGAALHITAPVLGPNQSRRTSVIQIKGHADMGPAHKNCGS